MKVIFSAACLAACLSASQSTQPLKDSGRVDKFKLEATIRLEDAFESYGFDSAGIKDWLKDTSGELQGLSGGVSEEQRIELLEEKLQEASAYSQSILDNMLDDARSRLPDL